MSPSLCDHLATLPRELRARIWIDIIASVEIKCKDTLGQFLGNHVEGPASWAPTAILHCLGSRHLMVLSPKFGNEYLDDLLFSKPVILAAEHCCRGYLQKHQMEILMNQLINFKALMRFLNARQQSTCTVGLSILFHPKFVHEENLLSYEVLLKLVMAALSSAARSRRGCNIILELSFTAAADWYMKPDAVMSKKQTLENPIILRLTIADEVEFSGRRPPEVCDQLRREYNDRRQADIAKRGYDMNLQPRTRLCNLLYHQWIDRIEHFAYQILALASQTVSPHCGDGEKSMGKRRRGSF